MSLDWFRNVVNSIRGRGQLPRSSRIAAKSGRVEAGLSKDKLKEFVRVILSSHPDEIGCERCFEELDKFVDLVLDGRDAVQALPLVNDHLTRCNDCNEEFKALVAALQMLS
jgi:hypothetical protein